MENQGIDTTKPTLAMYDVRGIQNFIFRTDRVKEIIGASALVENIIMDALKSAVLEHFGDGEKNKKFEYSEKEEKLKKLENDGIVSLDWENEAKDEIKVIGEDGTSTDLEIQVLFIGGGNAYVMYRTGELAVEINRLMSRYVLDETYSLQLAIAMVNKTESYKDDYQKVQNVMSSVKEKMSNSICLGALPIVKVDDMTGYPVCKDGEMPSEISSKIHCFEKKKASSKEKKLYDEKIFDNMVTEKGKQSILAVVHIDGNNMGMRIRDLMQDEKDYSAAVKKMRTISGNINNKFKDAYDDVTKDLKKNAGKFGLNENNIYIRKIIVAGDDITFVCNGRVALWVVEKFVEKVSSKVMYGEDDKEDDIKKYGLSVCAGIAYIHSHFPFSTAYQVAEACCDSAKSRAKEDDRKEETRIGNWVDFQICKHIQNVDFDRSRDKDYLLADGSYLLRRPYYIDVENSAYKKMNAQNEKYSFERFKDLYAKLNNPKELPSSVAKEIRNTYPLGRDAIDELVEFMKSRGRKDYLGELYAIDNDNTDLENEAKTYGYINFENDENDEKNIAAWYDVLDLSDLYVSDSETDNAKKGDKADGDN